MILKNYLYQDIKGGILMAGLDNGINFIFDDDETTPVHKLFIHCYRMNLHQKRTLPRGGDEDFIVINDY